MIKYRIYIDEVGNSDLENSDNPNHRFLSLTGVIGELSYFDSVVQPQMEALKRKYFDYHSDDPIIFHRKEMLNARAPFERIKDDNVRKLFDCELLELLSKWKYSVVTVCLDKKRHKETYSIWQYDPYHYCLAMILERYALFLKRKGCVGDAMAESRGGKEDMRLKESFERLMNRGTDYVGHDILSQVLTSKELKVKLKQNNISGLQIADLVAHPSRNEILSDNGFIDKIQPFPQKIVELLQNKYDQHNGKIYGKKFI